LLIGQLNFGGKKIDSRFRGNDIKWDGNDIKWDGKDIKGDGNNKKGNKNDALLINTDARYFS